MILVGKKDGSWRLCVDDMAYNSKTMIDKFPIPVVDELIDDLATSKVCLARLTLKLDIIS